MTTRGEYTVTYADFRESVKADRMVSRQARVAYWVNVWAIPIGSLLFGAGYLAGAGGAWMGPGWRWPASRWGWRGGCRDVINWDCGGRSSSGTRGCMLAGRQ